MVTKATQAMMLIGVLALAAPSVSFADSSRERAWSQQNATPRDGESLWQRLVPNFSKAGQARVEGDLTPAPNWQSDSQAAARTRTTPRRTRADTARKRTRTHSATTAAKKTRTDHATTHTRTATRKTPSKNTEAWWWENVGNPPVDALSQCLDAYAAGAGSHDPAVKAADVVSQAMQTGCKAQYAEVVKVLGDGLGKNRYDKAMAELQRSTFLPTATAALDRVHAATPRQTAPKMTATGSEPPNIEAAKQAMFDCFNREADALALQNPAAAPLLAREVVARCDEPTRSFFEALFVAYPVDKKAHDASIRIAVEQNYMPAIAARIGIVRQGQPTVGRDTSGSATDSRARTTVVTEQ